jgi:hypothetical protein
VVQTSIALICCSNAAARRDVLERTCSRDLGAVIGNSIMKMMGIRSYLTFDGVDCDKMSGLGGEGEK